MTDPQSPNSLAAAECDPRIYLAAERTFLAWIRTGLALMGFGFVVARFGLFLREFGMRQAQFGSHSIGISVWFGTALVILGVVVSISATIHHLRQVEQLRTGTWVAGKPSKTAVAVALLLAVAGMGLAIYLVLVH